MHKTFYLLFGIILYFFFFGLVPIFGQNKADFQVNLSASVEELSLNLSGSIAPYASVLLSSGNMPLASIVADASGKFAFSNVSITEGFSQFCLDGIDIAKIGESYTCFTVPPAKGNIIMKDIFLAPIIGLQRDTVKEGEEAVISGYSIPNSHVFIHLGTNIFSMKANQLGYFIFSTKIQQAGKYEIFAGAEYENKKSLKPAKTLVLSAFSSGDASNKTFDHVVLILCIFCLLIILTVIFFRCRLYRYITKEKFFALWHHIKRKNLHHSWFIGY